MDGLKLASLKSFSKEVEMIKSGNECGVSLLGDYELIKGDIIECVEIEE
jgi:translation initiation factor IF-2